MHRSNRPEVSPAARAIASTGVGATPGASTSTRSQPRRCPSHVGCTMNGPGNCTKSCVRFSAGIEKEAPGARRSSDGGGQLWNISSLVSHDEPSPAWTKSGYDGGNGSTCTGTPDVFSREIGRAHV